MRPLRLDALLRVNLQIAQGFPSSPRREHRDGCGTSVVFVVLREHCGLMRPRSTVWTRAWSGAPGLEAFFALVWILL